MGPRLFDIAILTLNIKHFKLS